LPRAPFLKNARWIINAFKPVLQNSIYLSADEEAPFTKNLLKENQE